MANITVSNNSTQASLNQRLGSDLQFPIVNTFVATAGINLLLQDIQQLLLTVPGERVNRPDWGCYLRNQIWENINTAAIIGAASIQNALNEHEPRVTVLNVTYTVNTNTSLVTFSVQFSVNDTDSIYNLIFPFRTGTALSFA